MNKAHKETRKEARKKLAATASKKTPIAARFTKQLVNVNDQLCYAALTRWEFQQTLTSLVTSHPDEFTTDVLPGNPFAENIHRRMKDLPAFSQASSQVELGMGIVVAVEHCLAYLEEVQALRHSLCPTDDEGIKADAEEEQLRLKIEKWSGHPPTSSYFRTLGYFRLLRNHIAHINEAPHQSFKTHINSYGKSLNKFWNNDATDLHGIDFKSLATTQLTPNITFGIMNLLRACVQHIDHMVADTIPTNEIIRNIWAEILQSPRHKKLPIHRISSKIRSRLKILWNIDVPLDVISMQNQNYDAQKT